MKLIEQPRAPNPRRVRIFLAEKGIDIPIEQLDMNAQQHKSDAFARLNPFQQVPVLVLDDGTALSETVAICRYFEALHPEPVLMGRGALEMARIEMWNRRIELNLLASVAAVFRHTHPSMALNEVPQIPAWADANRPRVEAALAILDRQLQEHPFVAGESYSIADITALVAIDFMRPAKLPRSPELANITRWYGEVSARPSAKAGW